MTNKKTSTNSKEFEFYKNYANFVLPKLKEYEIERKKILWTAIGLTIVAMIIPCTISALIFGFQVKNLYELSGAGRYVECVKVTDNFVTFLDDDDVIKRKIKTESHFNGQIVEKWQIAQYGEYKIRAID